MKDSLKAHEHNCKKMVYKKDKKVINLFDNDMKLSINQGLGYNPTNLTNPINKKEVTTMANNKGIDLFSEYDPNTPLMKNWRVTYEVLFNGDTEPTRRVSEFYYFETAMQLVKRTEKHCNLIFANIERI